MGVGRKLMPENHKIKGKKKFHIKGTNIITMSMLWIGICGGMNHKTDQFWFLFTTGSNLTRPWSWGCRQRVAVCWWSAYWGRWSLPGESLLGRCHEAGRGYKWDLAVLRETPVSWTLPPRDQTPRWIPDNGEVRGDKSSAIKLPGLPSQAITDKIISSQHTQHPTSKKHTHKFIASICLTR